MFSKPIKQNKINDLNEPVLNYKEYYKNNIILKKYKLPELKTIVKKYKLRITGNKDELIDRIETLFSKMKNAEIIQKRFRGWIVRYSFILNGEIIKNRSLCVNDSDFVTLEPLEEIPRELFYSYKDAKNFYYGFNITSLIQMMKTKGKLTNPYNREGFDKKTLNNMISLYNIIQLIYPEHRDNTNKVKLTVCSNNNANILRNLDNNPLHRNISQRLMERYNNQDGPHDFAFLHRIVSNQPRRLTMNDIENVLNNNTIQTANNNPLSLRYYEPRVFNQGILSNNILRDNYNKIIEMRKKPIETRIQELFMEIDQLGEYTQSIWFSNLQRHEYILLYTKLYNIWNYRGITNEYKRIICPLFEPIEVFTEIFTQPINLNNISENQIKLVCVTIFENLVYSGIVQSDRLSGAYHALSALTLVSRSARNAMYLLYEEILRFNI